jgi:uncharacterized protein YecE (DUF72 family)
MVKIGTAGWSVPSQHAALFPSAGSHLERYSTMFNAVEINTSFYRPHKRATYERWAASVPEDFRFAVKIPRAITHERRLEGAEDLLERFLDETAGLGEKIGPFLLQLPPSLPFKQPAEAFLRALRSSTDRALACEPRHASWFASGVNNLLIDLKIAGVAADPAPVTGANEPRGWRGLSYYRLHGSPKIYYSAYPPAFLERMAERLVEDKRSGSEPWCILDNTAAFAATSDGLAIRTFLCSG